MNRITDTKRNLKYEFPDPEKLALATESAGLDREIKLLHEEKKSANSSFQSHIDEKESRRTRLSNCVADGFEFRDIDCEIKYNSPKDGTKQIVRKDNGEVVEEIPMTPEELQEEMEFKEAQATEAEEKRKAEAKAAGKEKQNKRKAMKERKRKETK